MSFRSYIVRRCAYASPPFCRRPNVQNPNDAVRLSAALYIRVVVRKCTQSPPDDRRHVRAAVTFRKQNRANETKLRPTAAVFSRLVFHVRRRSRLTFVVALSRLSRTSVVGPVATNICNIYPEGHFRRTCIHRSYVSCSKLTSSHHARPRLFVDLLAPTCPSNTNARVKGISSRISRKRRNRCFIRARRQLCPS